jgi:hypothetical protein
MDAMTMIVMYALLRFVIPFVFCSWLEPGCKGA